MERERAIAVDLLHLCLKGAKYFRSGYFCQLNFHVKLSSMTENPKY